MIGNLQTGWMEASIKSVQIKSNSQKTDPVSRFIKNKKENEKCCILKLKCLLWDVLEVV